LTEAVGLVVERLTAAGSLADEVVDGPMNKIEDRAR
jgi:hypothetical protein